MSPIGRLANISLLHRTTFPRIFSSIRSITTSNKKDDTTTVVGPTTHQSNQEAEDKPRKKRYFYDYGFGGKTEEEETNNMHAAFFMYVTLTLVGTSFYCMYTPTGSLKDWAQREAYLELRRREQLGLPLIDPNYVDPATVYLPSDEELGDTEIII